MSFIFGIIIGIVLTYLFKPQMDSVVKKGIKLIKNNRDRSGWDDEDDK